MSNTLNDVTLLHSLPAPQKDMTILFQMANDFSQKYKCDVILKFREPNRAGEPRTYCHPTSDFVARLAKELDE